MLHTKSKLLAFKYPRASGLHALDLPEQVDSLQDHQSRANRLTARNPSIDPAQIEETWTLTFSTAMGLGVLESKFAALLVATLLLSNAVHFSVSQESTDGIHFLLVHGAFHGAWCWYKVTTMLAKAGFAATALDMTSNGRNKTIADTVTSLAELAEPLDDFLANFPGQVVLVGHSLGGATISYAMERHPEKICKAIFLASVMPLNNESALTSIPPGLFQNLVVAQAIFQNFANGPTAPPTSVSLNLTSLASFFYNQSPPQDITLSLSLVDPEPYAPLVEVQTLTPSRYGSIRRFYVRTGKDMAILPVYQEFIIQNNPPEMVFEIKGSDHSAFFSKPSQLTKILIHIATIE